MVDATKKFSEFEQRSSTTDIVIVGYHGLDNVQVVLGTVDGNYEVKLGNGAGQVDQGQFATALGNEAGQENQGEFALALGYRAGRQNQGAHGIIINGSGVTLDDTNEGHVHLRSSLASLDYTDLFGWVLSGPLVVGAPTEPDHAAQLQDVDAKEDSIDYGLPTYMGIVNATEDGFDFIPQPDFEFYRLRGTAITYTGIDPDGFADTQGDSLVLELIAGVPPNVGGDPAGVTYRWADVDADLIIEPLDPPVSVTSGDYFYWSGETARWLHIPAVSTEFVDLVSDQAVGGLKTFTDESGIRLLGGDDPAGFEGCFRFNDVTGEFEGYSDGEWQGIGGGGVVEPIYMEVDFPVVKNESYTIEMGDDVSKVVTIPDGMGENEWFIINVLNWTGEPEVTVLVSTINEEWERSYDAVDATTRNIRISQNGTFAFQKLQGRWSVVEGVGEGSASAPYWDLEERVTELETDKIEATDEVKANGQNWDGVPYTDPYAVGANPTATLYPDGTIRGSTDNGSYVRYPNGIVEAKLTVNSTVIAISPDTNGTLTYTAPISSIVTWNGYVSKYLADFSDNGVNSSLIIIQWGQGSGTTIYIDIRNIGSASLTRLYTAQILVTGRWK